ncbi:MAG: endolytic transglycosylase MltG [Oscillospiraceae bacterium]|nr:endolytic transglycosylase MltG [Oscillospiraceae bacterium]
MTEKQTVRITFPEGFTVFQTANLLEEKGICSAEDFMEAANSLPKNFELTSNLKNAKNRIFKLEGYLFPDTYDFYKGEGAQNALWRFLKNTQIKLSKKDMARAKELGYSMDEVITLASVIQAEAGTPDEMKKVSSVFHNRLNSSYGRLESDATVLYIKEKLAAVIPEKDRGAHYEHYSTYGENGLPVGAICNPGRSAIDAALYPDHTNYMFFVTGKEDGKYYYANTFEQHKKNVKLAGW